MVARYRVCTSARAYPDARDPRLTVWSLRRMIYLAVTVIYPDSGLGVGPTGNTSKSLLVLECVHPLDHIQTLGALV